MLLNYLLKLLKMLKKLMIGSPFKMVCDNKIFRVEKFISLKEKFNNYFVNLEFEKLNKIVSKPFGEFGMPRIYIKTIASLEDFLNESLQKEKEAKEAKKKMNTTQAKALNSM